MAVIYDLAKGSGQTTLTRSLKPVNRYDVFRKNCGFLSELEQERWARLCDYTGDVKRLKDPVEMWTADEAFFREVTKEFACVIIKQNFFPFFFTLNSKQNLIYNKNKYFPQLYFVGKLSVKYVIKSGEE